MFSSFRTFLLLLFSFLLFILFVIVILFHIFFNNVTPREFASNVLHTLCSLKPFGSHIFYATDTYQTLNEAEDFELFFLYSLFCYLLPFLSYCSFSFMLLFCPSSDFIMGVYCVILCWLEWVMLSVEWRSSET